MYIQDDSNSDTRMRYRGCLVKVNGELVQIREIYKCTEDSIDFDGYPWKNFGYVSHQRYQIPLKDVDYSKIRPQYVNYVPSKGCGYIHRFTMGRTYSLGTKDENTKVLLLGPKTSVDLLPYSVARASGVYPSRERAYAQVSSGLSPARAISKRVAIYQTDKGIVIYILNNAVGVVTSVNTVELPYWHKYFKEEIEELGFTVNLKEE